MIGYDWRVLFCGHEPKGRCRFWTGALILCHTEGSHKALLLDLIQLPCDDQV